MADPGKRRLLVVLLLCISLAAVVLLAAGITGLAFPPAQHFARRESPTPSVSAPAFPAGQAETWLPLLRGVLILSVILFPFSLVYVIVSPQARKRLMRDLTAFVSLLLVLYAVVQIRAALEQMGASSSGTADLSDPALLPLQEFSAAPPPWLIYAVSLAVTILLAALGLAIILAILRHRRDSAPALSPLAQEAQRSLEALQAGGNLQDVVLRCYAAMNRIVSEQRGVTRPAYFTAREFERQLQRAGLPENQVRRLTHLFEDVRYGARAAGDDEQREAIACLSAIVDACREGTR